MTIVIAPSARGNLAGFTAYSSAGGEVKGMMVIKDDMGIPYFKPNDMDAWKRLKEVDAKYNGGVRDANV